MKKSIIIIIVSIICINCEKSEDNLKIDNVDVINNIDFTLMSLSPLYEPTKDSFNLDIDHDKITDITFFVFQYSLGREGTYYIKVKVLNDYEIAIQKSYKYDASDSNEDNRWMVDDSVLVDVPKVCEVSDTLTDQLIYKSGLFDFSYNHFNSWKSNAWSTYISAWKNSGDKYIGLRNNNNIYCWIKINIIGISQIHIISYRYTIDKDIFIIRED